ncbi:CGNR zinc finger domain-containing protein [Kineococcus xinjiangensis]|uniref:CGNR zinc finger domain-containing protein n=1 Tax=Kineococcus xinjiangensis TaxID=512762 RepID=UPI000CEBF645|nr:CGNR zinc finger domain-containing protein [Kineococcus xinjiangensis]
MLFAHDTEVALAAAAALVNTDSTDGELLPDAAALDRFLHEWRWTGTVRRDDAELAAVHALRPRLRAVWAAAAEESEEPAVEVVNALLREGGALPQLVRHDGWGYHVHATGPDSPLAARMAVEAAMALVDVIRTQELGRLRTCAAAHCDDVLVDLSKNRSRRFCNTTCSNRTNVAAFRARRRG